MRDRPYYAEHSRSVARKQQPPKNLLGWFLEQFRSEMPDRIHTQGVWRDRVNEDEARNGISAIGGSLLGSPRTSDDFRAYVEGSPFETVVPEYEGHKDTSQAYRFPLRAALARLGGRGRDSDPYPFMARTLYRTALRDGDYDGACASMGIVVYVRNEKDEIVVSEELSLVVRKVYIEEALRRLWNKYEIEPPARTLRTEAA